MKTKTQKVIDNNKESRQGKGFREHLGASIIGRECSRQIWYMFRWATRSRFSARMLRLFERGQREEAYITSDLRKSGIHVLDLDPETDKQFRIEDHEGHFGGSLDAKIFDCPDFPGVWVLGEYKTHNDKSFKELRRKGLQGSKPEHVVQAQVYMSYTELPACLYIAVNKNDDDREFVPIEHDPSVGERYSDRARRIIYAELPPKRLNDSPAWFLCRMCSQAPVCHHGSKKEFNCRTCIYSRPVQAGFWYCDHHTTYLTKEAQLQGCQNWQEIPED
jgi:hypothetical protein